MLFSLGLKRHLTPGSYLLSFSTGWSLKVVHSYKMVSKFSLTEHYCSRGEICLSNVIPLPKVRVCCYFVLKSWLKQTSANNSTPLRYSKTNHYSANIRGRIVGQMVGLYLTRGRLKYLYFRQICFLKKITCLCKPSFLFRFINTFL